MDAKLYDQLNEIKEQADVLESILDAIRIASASPEGEGENYSNAVLGTVGIARKVCSGIEGILEDQSWF